MSKATCGQSQDLKPNSTNLYTLNIGSNDIGDNGIKDLANVFKDCSKLHTLDIHSNHIGADGVKYLADGIKHCSMLHTLDIGSNSIW